jgi:hypothetical protein
VEKGVRRERETLIILMPTGGEGVGIKRQAHAEMGSGGSNKRQSK